MQASHLGFGLRLLIIKAAAYQSLGRIDGIQRVGDCLQR